MTNATDYIQKKTI